MSEISINENNSLGNVSVLIALTCNFEGAVSNVKLRSYDE